MKSILILPLLFLFGCAGEYEKTASSTRLTIGIVSSVHSQDGERSFYGQSRDADYHRYSKDKEKVAIVETKPAPSSMITAPLRVLGMFNLSKTAVNEASDVLDTAINTNN